MDLCGQQRFTLSEAAINLATRNKSFLNAISMHLSLIEEEVNMELKTTIQERIFKENAHIRGAEYFAFNVDTLVMLADDLIDTLYVVNSMLNKLGIPVVEVWNEVHRSNMEKAVDCTRCQGTGKWEPDGEVIRQCFECHGTGSLIVRRADGKILKPDGWMPPDIKSIILETLEKQRRDSHEQRRHREATTGSDTGT